MMIQDLAKSTGRTPKAQRVGRGNSCRKGNYCGKGMKGQKSRAGGNIPAWFEGGQTPLHMRLPKLRGFKRYFKLQSVVEVVNVGSLDIDVRISDGSEITKNILVEHGYIRSAKNTVKVLGKGALKKKLNFSGIESISGSARELVESAGGSFA